MLHAPAGSKYGREQSAAPFKGKPRFGRARLLSRCCAHLGWFQVETSAPQFIQEPKGKKKRKKSWKMSSVILDLFCNFTASLSEKFPTEITQRAGASSSFTNAVPCSSRPTPGPGADPSHSPSGTSPIHPSPAEHRTAFQGARFWLQHAKTLKPHLHCAEQVSHQLTS